MLKRVNFVLTQTNVELLNTYNSYAPRGFVLNLSELLNEVLEAELRIRLSEQQHIEQ
jgi:hypothetical protein